MTTSRRLILLATTLAIPACSSGNTAAPDHDAGTVVDSATPAMDSSVASDDAAVEDSGGDAAVPYPAGPYGVTKGLILPPTLAWQAYAPNETTVSLLKVTDLYDPDGSKGINAIVFDSSGQWCVACQYEAGNVQNWLSASGPNAGNWLALGVQFITLVVQTNSYEPATIDTASQWRTLFKETDIWVGADPAFSFPTGSLPKNVLVDPRSMKVLDDDLDSDSYDAAGDDEAGTGQAPNPSIAALAKKNKQ